MSAAVPNRIDVVGVKQDEHVSAYPFGIGFRREPFRQEIQQMVEQRGGIVDKATAITVRLCDGLGVGGHALDGHTTDAPNGLHVQLNARFARYAYLVRADQGEVDWDDLNSSVALIELNKTAVHEGSHVADRLAMGEQGVRREYFAHERRFTRKFRVPTLMGIAAVVATLPVVRTGVRDFLVELASMHGSVAAFLGLSAISGLYVAARGINEGVHAVAKRLSKCYSSQPGEIRAESAATDYITRMQLGEAPAIVVAMPKTSSD